MLILKGSSALSPFRLKKLITTLNNAGLKVNDARAQTIHLVETSAELSEQDQQTLAQLLTYGESEQQAEPISTDLSIYSVPRLGTLSPWSTKATDIAHHCGLASVVRIERGTEWRLSFDQGVPQNAAALLAQTLIDPMTESLLASLEQAKDVFKRASAQPFATIDILGGGLAALSAANKSAGFALTQEEQTYLVDQFTALARNPTDTELMMFAQVNSEHCRHKIFNADWRIDGEDQALSPFKMIKETHRAHGQDTLVAYHDNASVLKGHSAKRFFPNPDSGTYEQHEEAVHIAIKVETHNHPTAISPFSGAATGAGGEIRDEGATGRGGKPKAGLTGFSVSHLRLPGLNRDWESPELKPKRIASPLQIMLEGPIGAAAFNNEFGRPNLTGYFRSFEHTDVNTPDYRRGYHKPIMLAGGLASIRPQHVDKKPFQAGALLVVLGGPAMLIGLGGGAASSMATGASSEDLDFASVQRGNPEMQRRCQEVIDTCWAMGVHNPIAWIHDVGAGGLSNALPELVEDSNCSGHFDLRKILSDDPSLSPMQIWSNESQERYVLAIEPKDKAGFEAICQRERALYAVVGIATDDGQLVLSDDLPEVANKNGQPIDIPMNVLFGLPPKMSLDVSRQKPVLSPLNTSVDLRTAAYNVLKHPTVADKTFLITIGDRSVGGLVARDQMVGPWQVPVADVAVTLNGFESDAGEAMALGERTPLALLNAPASGRMAVGEALTNIAAASIEKLSDVRLSANWMVPAGQPGEDANLYDTVETISLDLCAKLGVSIPVGKDSMSMQTVWQDNGTEKRVVAPTSLVISAFAPTANAARTLTPQLNTRNPETRLWLLDLGQGKARLGGSIYAQTERQLGDTPPDVDSAELLKGFFEFIQAASQSNLLLAYHDRSDGGVFATLCEMAFTAHTGLVIELNEANSLDAALFNEELGAVIQCADSDAEALLTLADTHGLSDCLNPIAKLSEDDNISIFNGDTCLFSESRVELHRAWSETSWKMQSLRDNPDCAQQAYDALLDTKDPGLSASLTFNTDALAAPIILSSAKPKVAVLREQGVNGQVEMAAGFHAAGFEAVDVTMSDLISGRHSLEQFNGLAACGGFSFGDVLGAGEGWAKSILFNQALRQQFSQFFEQTDKFALGVCNGCQMLAQLAPIIPGADHWPTFIGNQSEQYEARYVLAEITPSPSLFMHEMAGSKLPIVVAHGEGRAQFKNTDLTTFEQQGLVAMRFIDNHGNTAKSYPANPNGTPNGITAITNNDGRITAMMPHPERILRSVNHSWAPHDWDRTSPWQKLFHNARTWIG